MKTNRLVAIVSNKKGDCYQVALDKSQEKQILCMLRLWHGGKINCISPKLMLTIGESK